MIHPSALAAEAKKLVAEMDLSEKASLMSGSSFWHLQSIERLGLQQIMVSDGPHGLRKQASSADHMGLNASIASTCFPTAVTLASSWNVSLMESVGQAIATECQAEDVSVLLGPGVNIKRNPLCGRNFEYYSEDPFLAGKLAAAFIHGVQKTGIGTSLKHFAANNQEAYRLVVDTLVDKRTLFEIYFPAFEIAIRDAQPWTVMCAYNRLNGVYCSEHKELLSDILRHRWGFKGLVVTDWGAVNDRPMGVAAGLEIEMPSSLGINDDAVVQAVEAGALSHDDLNQAAERVTQLILAAMQNATAMKPDFEVHHALARKAACEGAVLLKNQAEILPIDRSQSLALIGGFAETPRIQGAGSSQVNATQIDTPLDIIRGLVSGTFSYAKGFDPVLAQDDPALIAEAVEIARAADNVVILAGLPAMFEAEGFDRTHLRQPQQLETLIEAVSAVNQNCIVVLSNGSPIAMPWKNNVSAILETYLSGQAGASALGDLIFGDVSPSGKLAETFPLSLDDVPSQENFSNHPKQIIYREGLNVGYRYYATHQKPVLFPFGHGLTYSKFRYGKISCDGNIASGDDTAQLTVQLEIENIGERTAAEVVQLYVRDVEATVYRPDRELKAFAKISLEPGQKHVCRFELDRRAFSFFNIRRDDWELEAGIFEILIGASSEDIRQKCKIDLSGFPATNAPPEHEAPYSLMDDLALARLGLIIREPDGIRPYHVNTPLADIQTHWLGKRIVSAVFDTVGELPETADPVAQKMRSEMLLSMRLRTVQNLSRGAITAKRLDLLICALNGHWFKLLRRLLRRN
jgi:beta-glucosidase